MVSLALDRPISKELAGAKKFEDQENLYQFSLQ